MGELYPLISLLQIPPIENSIMSNLSVKDYQSLIQIGSWKKPGSFHQAQYLLPSQACDSLIYLPPDDNFTYIKDPNFFVPCVTAAQTLSQLCSFLPCQGSIDLNYSQILPKLTGNFATYTSMQRLIWEPLEINNPLIQSSLLNLPCQPQKQVCISCNNNNREEYQADMILRHLPNSNMLPQIGFFCIKHSHELNRSDYKTTCQCADFIDVPGTYCEKHWQDRYKQLSKANQAFVDYLQEVDMKDLKETCVMDSCMKPCIFTNRERSTVAMAVCLFCFTVYIPRWKV